MTAILKTLLIPLPVAFLMTGGRGIVRTPDHLRPLMPSSPVAQTVRFGLPALFVSGRFSDEPAVR
jgi:hypothetical protein